MTEVVLYLPHPPEDEKKYFSYLQEVAAEARGKPFILGAQEVRIDICTHLSGCSGRNRLERVISDALDDAQVLGDYPFKVFTYHPSTHENWVQVRIRPLSSEKIKRYESAYADGYDGQ